MERIPGDPKGKTLGFIRLEVPSGGENSWEDKPHPSRTKQFTHGFAVA